MMDGYFCTKQHNYIISNLSYIIEFPEVKMWQLNPKLKACKTENAQHYYIRIYMCK